MKRKKRTNVVNVNISCSYFLMSSFSESSHAYLLSVDAFVAFRPADLAVCPAQIDSAMSMNAGHVTSGLTAALSG